MTAANPPTGDHSESWDLIPWLVNGRVTEAERRRLERHLQECAPCREEYAAQRHLYQIIAADAAVEQMPTAGLQKLRQRLDQASATAAAQHAPAGLRAWRRRAFAIAATLIVAVAVAALSRMPLDPAASRLIAAIRPVGSADYRTVSATPPLPPTAAIRAVFAPALTVADLQLLLDDAGLRIVAGPSAVGAYALAATGGRPVAWSLMRLRAHATVLFAEVTATDAPDSAVPRR